MRIFATVLAITAGIIVLLGYFYPLPMLIQLRVLLTNWAVIIAAMAVLIGVYNLVAVHMEKIRAGQKGAVNSGVLVFALIITAAYGIVFGPQDFALRAVVNSVIVPVEGTLMAILAVTLIYASIRLLRRRLDVMSGLFLIAAVLVLIAFMPTPFGQLPGSGVLAQITGLFSTGGARGLLIGIALGVLLTGLRIIFGVDRPYGGH